jgi:hypothetical protein
LSDAFVPAAGANDWVGGLRLAAAFLTPIAVGLAAGRALTGLFVGIGAFMVANADLGESLRQRSRLMLPATVAVAGMTALGMVLGGQDWMAVPIAVIVLLAGALCAAFGREAAILGTFTSFAYVIGVGLAATPEIGLPEVVWPLLAGGAYAMLLSALATVLFRPAEDAPDEPWTTLWQRARTRVDTVLVRQSAAFAVAGAIGLVVVLFARLPNGAWLVTGALIVLKPGFHDTRRTAVVRAVGTVGGAAAAGALAAVTGNPWVLLGAAFAVTWLAEAVIRRSFGLFVMLITPLSVLLANVLVPGSWQVALLRTADVTAGSLIAIVVAALLLPRGTAVPSVSGEPTAARGTT